MDVVEDAETIAIRVLPEPARSFRLARKAPQIDVVDKRVTPPATVVLLQALLSRRR